MNRNENEEKDKNVLHAIYANKFFLKIKQWLSTEQMIFSFVDKNNSKETIDCYVSIDEFCLFCHQIKTKELLKKLITSKEKAITEHQTYADAVYDSSLGGKLDGNKAVARKFSILPGDKTEVVFKAVLLEAQQKDGLFVPLSKKPLKQIFIGCSYNELILIEKKWGYLEHDYFSQKYTWKNMITDYEKNKNNVSLSQGNSATATNTSNEKDKEHNENKSSSSPLQIVKQRLASITHLKELQKNPGSYAIKAKSTSDGTEYNIIFLAENIKQVDSTLWKQFEDSVNSKQTTFLALFAMKNGTLYFKQFEF